MFKGIDVSKWQGQIDWSKAKSDGVEFAILRAGYGGGVLDPTFAQNAKTCNQLGIPIGVYWFSYARNKSEAVKEAEFCLAAISPYQVQYPVCFDFEYDSVNYAKKNGICVTKALATQIADGFLNRIEQGGYYACNYMNYDFSKNMFDMSVLARYDIWYARYLNNPDRSDCGLWQYTSTGRVAGIEGNVDKNVAYKNYPQIILQAGLNKLSAPSVPPVAGEPAVYQKGDKVKVLQPIQYDNGKPFKTYYDVYDVLSVKSNRVVIGIGIVVTAAIDAKYLQRA